MPSAACSIAISGLAAFVVHEAFEVMAQVPNFFSFTPSRIVSAFIPSPSFDGAVITTCFAPQSR